MRLLTTCWLAVACLTGSGVAMADYDVFSEKLTPVVEFETDTYRTLFPDQSYSPLATFGGATYVVYVDPERRPMVTKIEGKNVTTARLDPKDDYQARDNGHHKFSLGIDTDGYIHVMGDMHHYPYSNVDHLPERYQKGAALYWVSEKPEDVRSFVYMGGTPKRCPEGRGFTYHYFVNDANGVLYYAGRQWSSTGLRGWKPGKIGYGIHRYDTKSKTWTALGGVVPGGDLKLVAWEDKAAKGGSYQSMRGDVRFDKNNRMHFTTTINSDNSINPVGQGSKSMTDVLYAVSDDGGETFHRADGSHIESLPMRARPGPNQADMVVSGEHWLSMPSSVAFTKDERPFVAYVKLRFEGKKTISRAMFRLWDGKAWTAPAPLALNAAGWDKHATDGRGVITLSATFARKICRTINPAGPGKVYDFRCACFDRPYLRATGKLRGLGGQGDKLQVIRLDIE